VPAALASRYNQEDVKIALEAETPGAAVADALSMAFFVMTDGEVAAFCAGHVGIGAALTRPDRWLELHGTLRPPDDGE
jgi:hypothetical protein